MHHFYDFVMDDDVLACALRLILYRRTKRKSGVRKINRSRKLNGEFHLLINDMRSMERLSIWKNVMEKLNPEAGELKVMMLYRVLGHLGQTIIIANLRKYVTILHSI